MQHHLERAPAHFSLLTTHAVFRPAGSVTLAEGIQLVTNAIAYAHEQRIRKLLIDITALTGFPPPDLGRRYFLVEEWARTANSAVCIAFVARPEMIDPDKFGVTVARNRGLVCDVFPTEPPALAWLEQVH